MKPTLKVVEAYTSNFRDPVATLREIANAIERGDHGEVTCVALALFGNKGLNLFGLGKDSDSPTVALVFGAAAHRFAKELEEHGDQ